jgi:hypothetical protein
MHGCQCTDGLTLDPALPAAAGYMNGSLPIPVNLTATHNVRNYGAKGDGIADDTQVAVGEAGAGWAS